MPWSLQAAGCSYSSPNPSLLPEQPGSKQVSLFFLEQTKTYCRYFIVLAWIVVLNVQLLFPCSHSLQWAAFQCWAPFPPIQWVWEGLLPWGRHEIPHWALQCVFLTKKTNMKKNGGEKKEINVSVAQFCVFSVSFSSAVFQACKMKVEGELEV